MRGIPHPSGRFRGFPASPHRHVNCLSPIVTSSDSTLKGPWTGLDPDQELRLVADLTHQINLGTSLDQIFNRLYDSMRPLVPYDRLAMALVNGNGNRLTITHARSNSRMVLEPGFSGTLAGTSLEPLIREGRSRILNDLQEYLARHPQSTTTRLIVREGMRSSLTLPLLVRGRPCGVIFFSSRRPSTYTAEHERILSNIVGHVAIAVERSRLIEALREKGEYLENILHNSADAIVVTDEKNRIVTWNEGARHIFGYEASEVVGRDDSMFLPPETRSEGESTRIVKLLERQGYVRNYECVRVAKDGRRLTVHVTSTLLRDKTGAIVGRSSICRDITELKKLQDDLLRTRNLAVVGELAATIAHEIKNPLAGISGAIQILQDTFPPTDARRGVVKEIMDQIRRLDSTVRDLLTFARPTQLQRVTLDLSESLQRAWSLLAQQPGTERIRFVIENPAAVALLADPELLHQVWLNLFQNAIEAMPEGGALRVRVADGPRVAVEISDNGPGIPPSVRAKLFQPFFSTKTRGTGLGLAISRKNIEAHGGSIRVESEPGRGTCVHVEVPR